MPIAVDGDDELAEALVYFTDQTTGGGPRFGINSRRIRWLCEQLTHFPLAQCPSRAEIIKIKDLDECASNQFYPVGCAEGSR